jgi:hypothetical protein
MMKLLDKKIEMTCRGVKKRSDHSPDWDDRAFHFEVIITIDGHAVYSGPYSVGRLLEAEEPQSHEGYVR